MVTEERAKVLERGREKGEGKQTGAAQNFVRPLLFIPPFIPDLRTTVGRSGLRTAINRLQGSERNGSNGRRGSAVRSISTTRNHRTPKKLTSKQKRKGIVPFIPLCQRIDEKSRAFRSTRERLYMYWSQTGAKRRSGEEEGEGGNHWGTDEQRLDETKRANARPE